MNSWAFIEFLKDLFARIEKKWGKKASDIAFIVILVVFLGLSIYRIVT